MTIRSEQRASSDGPTTLIEHACHHTGEPAKKKGRGLARILYGGAGRCTVHVTEGKETEGKMRLTCAGDGARNKGKM